MSTAGGKSSWDAKVWDWLERPWDSWWRELVDRATAPGNGAAMRRTRHLRRTAGFVYLFGPAAIVVLYLIGWITDDAAVITVALAAAGFPLVVYGKGNWDLLSGLASIISTAWTIALVSSVTPETDAERATFYDDLGAVAVVVITAALSLVFLVAGKRHEWPRRSLVWCGDLRALGAWFARNWWRGTLAVIEAGLILCLVAGDTTR